MKKIAVFGLSHKPNERRIAIHPDYFQYIPDDYKKFLFFEKGYCSELGITDDFLKDNFGGTLERNKLYDECDVWIIPKPTSEDTLHFQPGKILWGWPHCVQGIEITQAAIESGMTIVAWEAMYGGNDNTHIFYCNNELAGFAAVQHMMMLSGVSGYFGKKLNACILGFGASSRGAINGLTSNGIQDITVFTKRPSYLLNCPVENITYKQMRLLDDYVELEDKVGVYINSHLELEKYDIIVNCVLQNPLSPINFIKDPEYVNKSAARQLIIDVSCDEGMGFYFAEPTSLDNPITTISEYISYYSVDHTPSLYWQSASYEITKSIINFIPFFVHDTWKNNQILNDALEIEKGKIINKRIIKFQNRQESYPYKINY